MKSKFFKDTKMFFKGRETENVDKCIICGEEHLPPETIYDMNIAQCDSCGFTWLYNQPTQKVLDEYYVSGITDNWSIIKETSDEKRRQSEKYELLWRYVEENKCEKILDVGCGNGYFLNKIDSSVVKIGIEPSGAARNHCKFGIYESFDKFKDSLHGKMKYDMITMLGVLEHLKDPSAEIKKYSEFLHEDGAFAVIVPNVNSLAVQVLETACCTYCPQHLWYYNINTLGHLFYEHGFELDKWSTAESELQPILKKLRGLDPYIDLGFPLTDRDIDTTKILKNMLGYKIIATFKK